MDASGIVADLGAVRRGPALEKLKPGPGRPAGEVLAHQRGRLHRALVELAEEETFDRLTVRGLAARARISTRTFYKHFENVDDCLGSTYGALMRDALGRSTDAAAASTEWQAGLRAAVASLMDTFARDPQATRLVLIEIYSGDAASRKEIGAAIGGLESVLAEGFASAPRSPAPRHLVCGMAAGVMRIARKTAMAGKSDELPALVDQIVGWLVTLPDPELLRLQARISATGRHGRRREDRPFPAAAQTSTVQSEIDDRMRLLRAAARLAAADGFANLTAPKIRAEAGVSRRRFDVLFTDVRSCFVEAVAMTTASAARRAQDWALHADGWEERTARTILALAAQAARDRGLARLAFSEILAAGYVGLVAREKIITEAATALRRTIPPEQRPPALIAEASVAAAWRIAYVDAVAGRARNLPAIAPLLSYVVLAPIIGASTAALATSP
jgi:AcrR family transcriptional regulator